MQGADEKRGFWGVIVPMEILDNTDISANEKIVYCYVASYTKVCLDSNERIAERLGISERTVTSALGKLEKLQYVCIEYLNGNSSKRRIYAVYENPKKIAYLVKKGMFNIDNKASFPQGSKNCEEGSKNCEEGSKSCEPQNGGEGSKNCYQRIKEEKEEGKTEQKPNDTTDRASLAGCGPARSGLGLIRPRRADFESDDDYAEACYNWQTTSLGAN